MQGPGFVFCFKPPNQTPSGPADIPVVAASMGEIEGVIGWGRGFYLLLRARNWAHSRCLLGSPHPSLAMVAQLQTSFSRMAHEPVNSYQGDRNGAWLSSTFSMQEWSQRTSSQEFGRDCVRSDKARPYRRETGSLKSSLVHFPHRGSLVRLLASRSCCMYILWA